MGTGTILDRIVETKRAELARDKSETPLAELKARARDLPPPRDFAAALRRDGRGDGAIRLIAEVKKASPSKGVIREDFHPVSIAKEYAASSADAISCLTDEQYFQGHLSYLTAIRREIALPILRKDFTIDPYHVWQARVAGADAVLLIAAILSDETMRELRDCATELGLSALVEVHDDAELDRALALNARIIGVNNRNLHTFETALNTTFALRKRVPKEIVFVSESGIHTREDVSRLEAAGVDAMLVGESLMRSDSIGAKIAELRGV
ncbi:MAG: indole-3-glycerol phosphate synthase TrpC [Candidatus Poribacteria bacterium]|nr:indole-3-glycerol phosphate synthase TrpC [Candidatus Poribacteria bacterium]